MVSRATSEYLNLPLRSEDEARRQLEQRDAKRLEDFRAQAVPAHSLPESALYRAIMGPHQ